MTKDTISETAALKALLSETADHQILAEMLGFVADRLMALDVGLVQNRKRPRGRFAGKIGCGGSHHTSTYRVSHTDNRLISAVPKRTGADVSHKTACQGTCASAND